MARPRVGLTGGIASGKSAVADLLIGHGVLVIDADLLAREVVAAGTGGLRAVVDRFGPEVLTAEGELDRASLAGVVFADPGARADLEAIIHPAVRQRARTLERQAHEADSHQIVVQMIPLLVETGQQDSFDTVVVVDLPEHLQRARLVTRNGLSEPDVDRRVRSQATRGDRLRAADVVIDNSADPRSLEVVVARLAELLQRRAAQEVLPRR